MYNDRVTCTLYIIITETYTHIHNAPLSYYTTDFFIAVCVCVHGLKMCVCVCVSVQYPLHLNMKPKINYAQCNVQPISAERH